MTKAMFEAKFLREVERARPPSLPALRPIIGETELSTLPEPVQRYLRFMRVPGAPKTWSFRAHWPGRFRLGRERRWLACEAWQYNCRLGVTRIFHMRLRLGGVLPVLVRDTYVSGRGRMLGRVFDAFSVVDQSDEKIATGELVTYLNDAI